jgi:glycosyltransferase involved in cell wall biosynthesis
MRNSGVADTQRIAHLTSVHPVRDVRIYDKECRSLFAAGYDVVLVGIGESSCNALEPEIIGLRKRHGRLGRMLWTTSAVIRAGLRTGAQILHLHDPELIPGGLFLKLLRKRVIFDCHEFVVADTLAKSYLPTVFRLAAAGVARIALLSADKCFDAIVAATSEIRSDFTNRNVTVVNNYPEWADPGPPSTSIRDRAAAFAYIGAISESRGIKEMILALDIAAQRADLKLILAGEFDPPELLDEIERLPGWRFVEYKGKIPREEIPLLLNGSIGGLVTLHDVAGFAKSNPIKLFEYFSAGLPAIISRFPDWVERFGCLDACLTVDPRDPEELANKMLWLIENRTQAEAMGNRARKAAQVTYNWSSERDKLLELYAKLIGKPAARPAAREEIVPICVE